MTTVEEKRDVGFATKRETVVNSGQAALRALLTLNGGATIAFLTFLGHLWERGALPSNGGDAFVDALKLFIYGSFLAVLAYGTIFLTNCLSSVDWEKTSLWMFGITVALGFASIGCFLAASWQAVDGFQLMSNLAAAGPR